MIMEMVATFCDITDTDSGSESDDPDQEGFKSALFLKVECCRLLMVVV